MKKAILGLVAVVALGGALVACGPTTQDPSNPGPGPEVEKTIEVLVQTADHGWTGAVQSYAKEKVDELNAAGKYKVNLTACASPEIQAAKIDDLLTNKDSLHGIVMLPIDNTLESSVEAIANAGVDFVQFDRVISNPTIDAAESRVANVLGDNYGIGQETARAWIAKGLQPGDKVYIFPGDNSSVPVSRNLGFKETLVKEGKWTQEQVDAIPMSDFTGWSRSKSSELFETLGEGICDYNWIFTHDSEIAMGILESIANKNVTQKVLDHFKNGGVKSLASSSGLDEMYAVLEDKHVADYDQYLADDCYLFDVTYDPAMIKIAIQDLVDHIEGKTVAQKHVVPVNVVTKDNVSQYQGFGRSEDYRK